MADLPAYAGVSTVEQRAQLQRTLRACYTFVGGPEAASSAPCPISLEAGALSIAPLQINHQSLMSQLINPSESSEVRMNYVWGGALRALEPSVGLDTLGHISSPAGKGASALNASPALSGTDLTADWRTLKLEREM